MSELEQTLDLDERIRMECIKSPDGCSLLVCNQSVVSASRAKEGPKAGFRS